MKWVKTQTTIQTTTNHTWLLLKTPLTWWLTTEVHLDLTRGLKCLSKSKLRLFRIFSTSRFLNKRMCHHIKIWANKRYTISFRSKSWRIDRQEWVLGSLQQCYSRVSLIGLSIQKANRIGLQWTFTQKGHLNKIVEAHNWRKLPHMVMVPGNLERAFLLLPSQSESIFTIVLVLSKVKIISFMRRNLLVCQALVI